MIIIVISFAFTSIIALRRDIIISHHPMGDGRGTTKTFDIVVVVMMHTHCIQYTRIFEIEIGAGDTSLSLSLFSNHCQHRRHHIFSSIHSLILCVDVRVNGFLMSKESKNVHVCSIFNFYCKLADHSGNARPSI